jgi:circadian clock protein KaiC
MLLDDLTAEMADKTVHSVAHAVIRLEELAPGYGAERRRVRVIKYRGVNFAVATMTSPSPRAG